MSADTDSRKRSAPLVRDQSKPEGAPGSLRLGEPEPKAKPLGASEVARAFLHRMAAAGGEHSSVELTRNAKGDTQIKVAVRTGDTPELQTLDQVVAEATRVYDALRMVYPMLTIQDSR